MTSRNPLPHPCVRAALCALFLGAAGASFAADPVAADPVAVPPGADTAAQAPSEPAAPAATPGRPEVSPALINMPVAGHMIQSSTWVRVG